MIDKIENYIVKNNLIDKNENIVVGFSGGPDSVMLLVALNELKKKYGYNIVAVHLNHQIRGKDALRDEKFAVGFSKKLGVKCVVYQEAVEEYARANKISVEDAGRRLRYEKFNETLRREFKSGVIAVGHHKNDQAETVLLNLIRGSGATGMSGINARNKNVVRPLLELTKEEIVSYLNENHIDYVEDQTNFGNDYVRNKIRNVVIPYVESELNPNFIDSIYRFSTILEDESAFLDKYVEDLKLIKDEKDYFTLDTRSFKNLHISIQRRLILNAYEAVNKSKKDISFNNVETLRSLILENRGEFYLGNYLFYMAYDKLFIVDLKNIKSPSEILVNECGEYEFGKYRINIERVEERKSKAKNTTYFPIELLEEGILIRTRKNGDKIRLKGYSKKVKDILIDDKIPKHLRDIIPIFTYKDDIIWISGNRRTNDYTVDSRDKFMIKIKVEDMKC